MAKITFIGAGSSIFVKNVLGDCLLTPSLHDAEMALVDIDAHRLEQSFRMLTQLNENLGGHAKITSHLDRRDALPGTDYIVIAIAVGEYDPYIISDFAIPERYGLEQTVADTLGVGGLFRGLRTIPVMLDIAKDVEELCPDAHVFNYTNPMCIVSGAVQQKSSIKLTGLCHSVQVAAKELLEGLNMPTDNLTWKIGGINHQAWMLELKRNGIDIYPEVKRKALERTDDHKDKVRYEMMRRFGYYLTESSSHGSEYLPYFHKRQYPDLKEIFHLPTNGYRNWGNGKANYWREVNEMIENKSIAHSRSREYASYIFDAIETNTPYEIAGNVLNTNLLIPNLPLKACVEVPCLVNGNGVLPTYFGELPEQCAGINRTNINMQLMAIQAGLTGDRDAVYQSVLLDPHASSELCIDEIVAMCDEMLEFNKEHLPNFN